MSKDKIKNVILLFQHNTKDFAFFKELDNGKHYWYVVIFKYTKIEELEKGLISPADFVKFCFYNYKEITIDFSIDYNALSNEQRKFHENLTFYNLDNLVDYLYLKDVNPDKYRASI